MNQDDFLAGEHPQFERMGAIARAMGQGFFENPMFVGAGANVLSFGRFQNADGFAAALA